MDDAASQKISEMLKDPETLSKIASVVGSLTQTDKQPAAAPPIADKPALPVISKPSNDKTALLAALKPLLRDDKKQKIDKLINALAIASVIKNIKGGNGNVQQ